MQRLGGRVAEVPILFEDCRVGRSKMSGAIIVEALRYVVGLAIGRLTRGSSASVLPAQTAIGEPDPGDLP